MTASANPGGSPPFPQLDIPAALRRWLATCDDGDRVPWHIEHLMNVQHYVDTAVRLQRDGYLDHQERVLLQTEFEESYLGAWNARRVAEHALADYIESLDFPPPDLVKRLRSCRMRGAVGRKPDGRFIVAWESKCSLGRLCPDEARAETLRLIEKYVHDIRIWISRKPGRRVHYGVFTARNVPPGELAAEKRRLFDHFKAWLAHEYHACPLEPTGDGYARTRRRKLAAFPQVQGALVVQEDPLSASDDWNVHLNVLLLTEGRFDYGEARELWGSNLHFQVIEPGNLTRAVLEVVKYATQIVPTKSADKRDRHSTDAPAMIEWPSARWAEWWRAQQRFRRTRSYGCLYALDETRWKDLPIRGTGLSRREVCGQAGVSSEAVGTKWRELDQRHGPGTRDRLRLVWINEERVEFDIKKVMWLGRIVFVAGAGYWVDLIQENNSRSSNPDSANNSAAEEHSNRGPPLH